MQRGHLLKVARLLTLTLRFASYNKMDELSKLLFWDRENTVAEIIKNSVNVAMESEPRSTKERLRESRGERNDERKGRARTYENGRKEKEGGRIGRKRKEKRRNDAEGRVKEGGEWEEKKEKAAEEDGRRNED